jgi:hypothetical protein
MSPGFTVSTAALRAEHRQRRRLHALLIVAAGAAATGAMILAVQPAFKSPPATLCFEITPEVTKSLPPFFGSNPI